MESDRKDEKIIIAGSGGQGVLLIGKILAWAMVDSIPHITFFPSYGAEVRGGVSSCQLVLSQKEIASPVSEKFDTLILMNQSSVDRYTPHSAEGSMTIINSSMAKVKPGTKAVEVPSSDISHKLGNTKAGNFVLLGVYVTLRHKNIVRNVEAGIAESFRHKDQSQADLNMRAFRAGLSCSFK